MINAGKLPSIPSVRRSALRVSQAGDLPNCGLSMIPRRVALACAIVLCATLPATAQIIQNGSFESNYNNWTATGHQGIATSDPGHPASDGNKVVVLNPNDQSTSAVLSQNFATSPGQRYGLTFDYGTVNAVADQRVQVTIEGNGTLYDQRITISAPDSGAFYVPQHISFIANSASTKLTVADASFTYVVIDSLLDNIQVVAEPALAPSITTDPHSTFAVQGQDATFSVAASGSGSLTYQWKFNGSDILNANSSSYTVTSADNTKAGNYSVTVTNASGAITSSAATLTVIPPAILLNGSFEYGSAAWTFSSGGNVTTSTNTGYGVTDGSELCHFNWGQQPADGNLKQTFATTAGVTYVVEFDLGAFSLSNQNEQRCHVTVTDGGNGNLATQDISVFANGNGGSYSPQSLTFLANGSSATLTFQDISPTTINVDMLLDNVRVRVQQAPLITAQPQNVTAIAGDPATFTVTAAGDAPLNYQWRFNDGNSWVNVGTNSNSFTINSTQNSDAGLYDVIITNNFGQVTSSSAVLTVITPGVFANGSFESGYAGWTASGNQLVVSGSGYTPSDGVKSVAFNGGQQPANGVLSQSFTTVVGHSYLLTFDAGAISFSNQNEQRMQVTLQGQGQAQPLLTQSVSVFAPGNGTRYTSQSIVFVADSSNTTLTFQDTSPTTQNVDLMLDNVQLAEQPPPGAFANGSFESNYTGWTATGNQGIVSGAPFVATNGTKAVVFNAGQQPPNGTLSQTFATTANQTYLLTFDAGAISSVNQAQQLLKVIVTGGNSTLLNQTVSVFAPGNGTQYVPQTFSFVANSSTTTLMFQDISATSQNVDLMLDNVQVASQSGPHITAQPQNTSAQVGGSASFNVTATGQGTVSYQWRFNNGGGWADIPSANASAYTINSVQNGDAGSYEVVVSDTSGQPAVTSSSATLTIAPAGVPSNGSFEFDYAGWTATGHQAVVSGAPFVASDGAKAVVFNAGQQSPDGVLSQTITTTSQQAYSLTFDVGAISFSNQSVQRLQVTVLDGSNNALLGPQIVGVSAPGNGTAYSSQNLTFTANGASATIKFQDVSLTSQNVDLMLDNVKVTALSGPVITSQPQSTNAQSGGSASFSVSATGQGTLSYQWRFNNGGNWTDIPNSNASILTIDPVQNSDAGSYDVIVSDTSGQPPVTSGPATLTVLPAGVPANGSFEFDYANWTATGNQAVVSGAPFTVTDGSKAVAFNVGQQTPNGTLSQTIATNQGQTYSLTFDAGALSGSNQSEQRLQVTVQGSNNTNVLAPQIVSVFAPGNGTHYVPQTFTFTADGANATLIFQDVSPTSLNVDLMLDNVRVTQQSAKSSFTNGSFESDYSGWTFAGHQGVVSGSPFVSTDGVKAVVFNAGQQTPNGTLSQGFSTTANQGYVLTFDAGAISSSNQNEQRLQVSVVDDNNAVLLAPQIVSVFAPGNGTTYLPQTFNFTASGTGATVLFQDVSQTSQNIDLMLDNVQIAPQGP
jgi:Ig-like domain-containing protein/uncharacterized protein DUF642